MNVTFDRPGWSTEILKALHVFHQQEEYCDVVVVCNDKKIHAHSCVLAAASPWVASELECGPSEGPVQVVSLEETPSYVVQYIMTFVYTGQFKVPLKHLRDVQALASHLKIKCMDGEGENNEGQYTYKIPRARDKDYEVQVPDSSLPSDTVVTLNQDWTEADSTPLTVQPDTSPSHSLVPLPTVSQSFSLPLRLKRHIQDKLSDIPEKRKRGRPKKKVTKIAAPGKGQPPHTDRPEGGASTVKPAGHHDTDSDNDSPGDDSLHGDSLHADSLHDDSPHDEGLHGGCLPDKQEASDSEGWEGATNDQVVAPVTKKAIIKTGASEAKKTVVKTEKKKRNRKSVNTQYKGEDGRYYCPDCDRNFAATSSFIEHRRRHEDNFRYTCTVCEKGFMSKASWKSHYLRHMNVQAFPCDQCDKGFVHKKDLKQHIDVVHKNIRQLCSKCGATFNWHDALRQHQKSCIHGAIEQCPHCPYQTKFRTNLVRHQRRKHMDMGEF